MNYKSVYFTTDQENKIYDINHGECGSSTIYSSNASNKEVHYFVKLPNTRQEQFKEWMSFVDAAGLPNKVIELQTAETQEYYKNKFHEFMSLKNCKQCSSSSSKCPTQLDAFTKCTYYGCNYKIIEEHISKASFVVVFGTEEFYHPSLENKNQNNYCGSRLLLMTIQLIRFFMLYQESTQLAIELSKQKLLSKFKAIQLAQYSIDKRNSQESNGFYNWLPVEGTWVFKLRTIKDFLSIMRQLWEKYDSRYGLKCGPYQIGYPINTCFIVKKSVFDLKDYVKSSHSKGNGGDLFYHTNVPELTEQTNVEIKTLNQMFAEKKFKEIALLFKTKTSK